MQVLQTRAFPLGDHAVHRIGTRMVAIRSNIVEAVILMGLTYFLLLSKVTRVLEIVL